MLNGVISASVISTRNVNPRKDMMRLNLEARVTACFWGLGLLNNVLYVVILSAAVDLVGARTPKGVVLLADVLPSFVLKLTAPFFIHRVPYALRVGIAVALSVLGMFAIALLNAVPSRLVGVMMASASSGLGEITFLQLTHYYEGNAIHGWSSGTGAAGLVGSFLYMVLTSWLRVGTRTSLFLFSILPLLLQLIYSFFLPRSPKPRSSSPVLHEDQSIPARNIIELLRPLVFPYILPLTTVYLGEYLINQGISPTLLFPLEEMPVRTFRDAYVTYGTLYQIGVFISRSSALYFRIYKLWLIALLQLLNVVLLTVQSLAMILPNIYTLYLVIFYEGLLGGLSYVNTFMCVSEEVQVDQREFALGAVTVSDSSGIVIAGLISLWLEPALCSYQISDGRPWCEQL